MSVNLSRPFRTVPIRGHILLFEPLQPILPSRPAISQGRRAQGQSRMAVALIVPTRRLISRPLLDWPERDGRLGRVGIALAARRASLPSRNRAHAAIRRAPDRYRTPLSISRGSPHVKRVQQVQRRCPWARATIASPYIRQLRYGLPLCCMHGQSREKDGAHLHNGRLARPNLRWVSPATHPTRPTLHPKERRNR